MQQPIKTPHATDLGMTGEILDKLELEVLLLTGEGEIFFANSAFLTEFNLPHASGLKIYDPRFDITTEEALGSMLDKARANNGRLKYEYKRKVNGREHYAEIEVVQFNLDGHEMFMCLANDITELKESQLRAIELNNMLNKIIDNLPVYLFVKDVDDDFRYLIWNKAFAEYSKIPAEKVIGRTDFEVFPEYADAMAFRKDDLRVVETGEMDKKVESYLAADGTSRVVQTYKTLVERPGRGPLLVGISLELTDIQGIEDELVRARLRAEESDRLKSRFLANMSHEIRTPLNAIVGFSNLLPEAETEEERKQFLHIINENTDLLLHLINDILDLSRIEAGTLVYNRAPMDLMGLCASLKMVYRGKVKPGVNLIFDNESTPCKFIINEDHNRLTQVMDNLLNNAVKFTEKGEIHFGFVVKDDKVLVYVSDTGCGIPKEKQPYIFDRFVKADNFSQGTGLGLSISKVIVELLGGAISVTSDQGKGSTFVFSIPYVNDRKYNLDVEFSHTVPHHHHLHSYGDNTQTILVAEDVESNYLVVKTIIKGRYRLMHAVDGNEAVAMAKAHRPDLIIMDLKMPRLDGLAATKEIREFDPDVPIVALTANAYDYDQDQAMAAGMDGFLRKPLNREAFEEMLREYLG